jgi:isoquinoline 1-oxidoreductase
MNTFFDSPIHEVEEEQEVTGQGSDSPVLTSPLTPHPSSLYQWSRRDFFGIAGSGVVVALLWDQSLEGQESKRGGRGEAAPSDLAAWIHIGEDSSITVFTGKVEIGQNARTSFTQVVAEELHVPVDSIKVIMGDTALVPFDMGTFGSQSTPRMVPQLRRAAAAAREALIDLASKEGNIDRASLSARDGKIVGKDGKPEFIYGQLTKGQKLVKVISADVPTTKAEKWTVTGTSLPKVDGQDFVTGKHQYASDTHRPGMLVGKVLRPSAFKAKLVSLDSKEAEAMSGVAVVHSGDFVGTVAPNEFVAGEALALLKPQWEAPAQISNKELFSHLKEKAGQSRGGGGGGGGGRGGGSQGSIEEGLAKADKTVKATYTIAYIAHVPLEPRAAVAEWADDKLTVWTGTQRPFGVRSELASAFNLQPERVRVIVPDMGSGYGGKHSGEVAIEAAKLAKAVGKPVKVVWTREEEMTWAYFRPAGVIEVSAGAKSDGTLTAWEFHNYNSGPSGIATPYEVANRKIEFHNTDSPLKQGAYRGLAATANHFVRESAMDELAHALGLDPLEFRLKNLKEPRLRAVLEAACGRFGWGKSKPKEGHGFGLAAGTEKGSYVGCCAEIAVDKEKRQVQVLRAVTAFECGAILNPDHLKNQVEGALIMGLGGALFEQMEFAEGKILNANFTDYRLPRFRDVPVVETILLDRKDLSSAGAGETPIVGIAPAVGNAIFQATGMRLRSMPMVPGGLPS